jgi:hypothetical protein
MFPFSSVYRCILGIFYLCLYVHLYFKHFTLITQNKSDKTKLSHKHLNKIDKPTAHRYGHEHGVYHAFPPGPPQRDLPNWSPRCCCSLLSHCSIACVYPPRVHHLLLRLSKGDLIGFDFNRELHYITQDVTAMKMTPLNKKFVI